ncbi:hypothetical protein PN836_009555 [Ningiella sp. W23]|uniref:hypothetical protein n=1 Tax=Ningiella sp. W23 TaxID=3023715 RepID=UPI00375680AC
MDKNVNSLQKRTQTLSHHEVIDVVGGKAIFMPSPNIGAFMPETVLKPAELIAAPRPKPFQHPVERGAFALPSRDFDPVQLKAH